MGQKFGFVSAGSPANLRQTFAKEDQENLYNLVQVGMIYCTLMWSTSFTVVWYMMVTHSCSFQAPAQPMELEDLKVAVEEH